jgi:hypothetical protein
MTRAGLENSGGKPWKQKTVPPPLDDVRKSNSAFRRDAAVARTHDT